MLIDATYVDSLALEADVCVIGCGAAGLSLAAEFTRQRRRVVLLESGGLDVGTTDQDAYRAEIVGRPFDGAVNGRFRAFGGSTTRWGGQALRLSRLDFERRPWVSNSGWPIRYEELESYYSRAEQLLLLDDKNYDSDLFEVFRFQPPNFAPGTLDYHFSKWSPKPDFGRRFTRLLRDSRDVTAIIHASVTGMRLQPGSDALTSVDAVSPRGGKVTVRARFFVLAAGGIETARILLASRQDRSEGLGNETGMVGRFFADHPCAVIGELSSERPDEIQNLFNLFHRGRRKYSVRLSLSREEQEKHHLLNASASIFFELPESSGVRRLADVLMGRNRRDVGAALSSVLASSGEISDFAWAYLVRRRTYKRGARFKLHAFIEQEPDAGSRVSLSTELDRFGMPRSRIEWRPTELSGRTLIHFASLIRKQFAATGVGDVRLESWLERSASEALDHMAGLNHHMGTARMSGRPQDGVVNEACRIHTVANLFVAGSAVFPTSGHSNPTLTIIALALRLADTLKAQLAKEHVLS